MLLPVGLANMSMSVKTVNRLAAAAETEHTPLGMAELL